MTAITAALKRASDSEVCSIIVSVCGSRPMLQESILQALSRPSARSTGVIKSFFPEKQYGFIECEEALHAYGRDVFLSAAQLGGFGIGSLVSFVITHGKSGQPQAQDLEHASAVRATARPPFAPGELAGHAKGGGKSKGPVLIPRRFEVEVPAAKRAKVESYPRAVGIIKNYSPEKMFGFIECPELFEQCGRDVFLSSVQIGNFDNGSVVSFMVTLNSRGHPQAQDLSAELTPGDDGDAVERCFGTIKKFDANKQYGFIECPEIHAHYGVDCFLSDKQIGAFDNGSYVSFFFDVKDGKPQAYDLQSA